MFPDAYHIGDLVRLSADPALYYLAADGHRYVFPTDKTYFTWYAGFGGSKTINSANLAAIPIGRVVTDRPGAKMVKQQTNPTVFVVSRGGVLRAVPDEATAKVLYGADWSLHIEDINDAFWSTYTIGQPLASAADYSVTAELAAAPTIDADKGLEIASAYGNITVPTSQGNFSVKVVELSRAQFRMITDTGDLVDCSGGCQAKSLNDYIGENGGTIGIHGTYFCPPDYPECLGKEYSYFPPVYNSEAGVMINEGKLRFHDGPLIAADTAGKLYYYHRAKDFGSTVTDFETANKVKLGAEIANYPSLVENGQIVVFGETMDDKQRTLKGTRGAIGFNGQYVFLVIGGAATVPDMAYVLQALGATDAMNLDGGGSAAMIYNGIYVAGPGRLLPNAVVFKTK